MWLKLKGNVDIKMKVKVIKSGSNLSIWLEKIIMSISCLKTKRCENLPTAENDFQQKITKFKKHCT